MKAVSDALLLYGPKYGLKKSVVPLLMLTLAFKGGSVN